MIAAEICSRSGKGLVPSSAPGLPLRSCTKRVAASAGFTWPCPTALSIRLCSNSLVLCWSKYAQAM